MNISFVKLLLLEYVPFLILTYFAIKGIFILKRMIINKEHIYNCKYSILGADRKLAKKKMKSIDTIIIITISFCIVFSLYLGISRIPAMPLILLDKAEVYECTVLESYRLNVGRDRTLHPMKASCITDDYKQLKFNHYDKQIHYGNKIKIKYYKYIEAADVVEIIY